MKKSTHKLGRLVWHYHWGQKGCCCIKDNKGYNNSIIFGLLKVKNPQGDVGYKINVYKLSITFILTNKKTDSN